MCRSFTGIFMLVFMLWHCIGDDALMTVIKTNLMTTHVHVKYKDKYNDVPRTCNAEVQRCPET